jgi:3alpha(or 20beta)-hydroxysteroid dehydrogenase
LLLVDVVVHAAQEHEATAFATAITAVTDQYQYRRCRTRPSGGAIIKDSSIMGLQGWTTPTLIAYSTNKWAIRGLTRTAAAKLASAEIQINSIHSGHIDPELRCLSLPTDPAMVSALTADIPAGYVGVPTDLAGAIVFVAGEDSQYITDAELAIGGCLSA